MTPSDLIAILKQATPAEIAEIRNLLGALMDPAWWHEFQEVPRGDPYPSISGSHGKAVPYFNTVD